MAAARYPRLSAGPSELPAAARQAPVAAMEEWRIQGGQEAARTCVTPLIARAPSGARCAAARVTARDNIFRLRGAKADPLADDPRPGTPRLTGPPLARGGGEGTRDAGASLGETASAVFTAGWKYLASPRPIHNYFFVLHRALSFDDVPPTQFSSRNTVVSTTCSVPARRDVPPTQLSSRNTVVSTTCSEGGCRGCRV